MLARMSATLLEPGRSFGPFDLVRLLGKGGAGSVWEAEDRRTGRRVALKVLTEVEHDAPEARARFEREGRLAASLSHPACVYVFGAEEVEGRPVISMELMRGGTLDDRLAEGAVPPAVSVDYALQLVDGLEAAYARGILHRDVKPSNCFLDAGGAAVKIGDFGVSTLLGGPSDLSRTGLFFGTPHYASPEQIRGETLDVGTDLYSLGALLYELLTGVRPFQGEPLQAVANILTSTPVPPSAIGRDIPRGLSDVVMRLLEKERDKRPRGYAALRAALVPYSSLGPEPAGLRRRVAAGVVDFAVCMALMVPGVGPFGLSTADVAAKVLAGLAYYVVCEGIWGRTPGKVLRSIRVAGWAGSRASLARVTLRALVFWVVPVTLFLTVSQWLYPLLLQAALFVTARRRNGFRGLHEIVSGTRVVRQRHAGDTSHVPDRPPPSLVRADIPLPTFGPYRTTGVLWATHGERVYAARDDRLDRDVWIHSYAEPGRAPPTSESAEVRVGRLRWLQGDRREQGGWDAYGAPGGTGFRAWIAERGPVPWARLRPILVDVAREIEASAARGLVVADSLDAVWVDGSGHVKLLGFPIPTAGSGSMPPAGAVEAAPGVNGGGTGGDLLLRMLRFGITGEEASAGGDELDGLRLPVHAREVLAAVAEAPDRRATAGVFMELAGSRGRSEVLDRGTRVATLVWINLGPLLLVLLAAGATALYEVRPRWVDTFFLSTFTEWARDTDATGRREAARVVLANLYHEVFEEGRAASWVRVAPGARAAMSDAAAGRGPVEPSVLRAARARLGNPGLWTGEDGALRDVVLAPTTTWLALVALSALLAAFALRGGVSYSLLGIRLVDERGRRVGRARCVVRALVAWCPCVALVPRLAAEPPGWSAAAAWAALLVLAVGAAYSVYSPERGIPDRLVGTWAVRR